MFDGSSVYIEKSISSVVLSCQPIYLNINQVEKETTDFKMTRLMSRQKVRLFELIEENYEILMGTPNTRGGGAKTAKWEEVKEILNDLGPQKTTEKWRRVWTDIRKTLRKKCNKRKLHETQVGGKMPDELIFSESDLWVLRICGMQGIKKTPNKNIKQEIVEIETEDYSMWAPSLSLPETKRKRSSERIGNQNFKSKKEKLEEPTSDSDYYTPALPVSGETSRQCIEDLSGIIQPEVQHVYLPPNPQPVIVGNPLSTDNNEIQLKKIATMQRQQLAVVRQIHERQKAHNSDQRQFNAKVTNLLEAILQQLKANQTPN